VKSIAFFVFISITCLQAQQDAGFIPRSLTVKSTNQKIEIDGQANEEVWASTPKHSDFYMQAPVDGKIAEQKTEVQLTSNSEALYLFATCYDDPNYVIQTLKRDNFGEDDAFFIVIDAVNQKSNGYGFGVNALGAMTEVLVTDGDVDNSWDNRWKVVTVNYETHWTVEMEIPFKTLRFESGKKQWGVNFGRVEPGSNEVHVWSPIPRQFSYVEIGYCGQLNWEQAPTKQGKNIALIPYVSLASQQNKDENTAWEAKMNVGGDAKFALSTGLNLDLTINPDFSQVEIDQQQTNLTQFDIFFPERRQFFIENSDIFSGYGQFANSPFYSRRIGLSRFGEQVPIRFGARLTGNLNKQLRIGAFNISTDEGDQNQNFSALTFQQAIGVRSNVKGIFLNRQAFQDFDIIDGNYSRNLGGEINLIKPDGKIAGQLGYIQSFKEGISTDNKHIYGRVEYNGQNFRTFLFIQNLGEDYYADMGFNARIINFDPRNNLVERIGYTQIGNMVDYYLYPKSSQLVNYHWSGIENFIIINEAVGLNQWYTRFRHFIFFKNSSQLRFRVNHIYDNLIFDFAITEPAIPAGEYDTWEVNVQFNTDIRKPLNFEGYVVFGDFYVGKKLTYIADLNFRVQPWANFSLGLEQNLIRMPEPYGNVDLTLASARLEFNFSTSLFWTSFIQYNTQRDNFNINTRLQWRYAPMSDFFLVYTDNYRIENMFGSKNRSLVLKASYWLGL